MAENREYKSDVFSMLLEEPENALDVYNALNGTDYDDPDMVVVHMLEKGFRFPSATMLRSSLMRI